MDPFSITASIITVATLAASTGRAFGDLRDLCKTLPGRLHALSNEVADIELVLHQVASVVEKRACNSILQDQHDNIPQLLKQGQAKLEELRTIIQKITEVCRRTKIPLLRVHSWRKDQPKLQALQEDIKIVKCSLNVMLGASNSQDMMRIRVDLHTMSAVSSRSAKGQHAKQDELQTSLVRHHDSLADSLANVYQQVDTRIGAVEELLKAQSIQLEGSQFSQIGHFYGRPPSYTKRSTRPAGKQAQYPRPVDTNDVGVRVTQPIAASDNSPRNKAHQSLLMGGLSDEDVEALRCVTQDTDFVDDQHYTTLHRIILGLSLQDLEEEIRLHPEDVNTTDVMGRTPLAWAACRGDERSIVTLLRCGAKVNTLDIQHSGIVGHAADRNYVTCVRLLLEAGADPDIAAAFGHKVGNPLNVAARNASDPLLLKTLLDFGADVNSSGVDGMTGLIHAARRDNPSFATLLLEYGANINATSAAGHTPLTTAVVYNSHNVLQLLLDRWFEYSSCPRLTGPHLLQIVSLYADVETMTILTATDHLLLKYDQNYALGDFISRLTERPDATEKLIRAFDDLLSVIKQGAEVCHSPEKILESGLLSHDAAYRDGSDSEISDQEFENALENLQISTSSDVKTGLPVYCR
ncbi:MAG: hypothetical protein M1837_006066 [Sclerophora amabilis]|nr:MAG: hypothetical protein M1837_006066 [Sclerophora amabilis]